MELTIQNLQDNWAELSHDSIELTNASSATTKLDITLVTADTIGLSYNTMSGNQPNSYGNYVALWQNTDTIPWNNDPLKVQNIDTNTQSGSMFFTGLSVTNQSFIIGYAVGSKLNGGSQQQHGNICSTASIPALSSPGNDSYPTFTPSLQILYVGPNSVAVQYNLPKRITPQRNGAWGGIWRSELASYKNPPMASNSITLDAETGSLVFNNISIGRGLTYTIALFTSGWSGGNSPNIQTAMACSVTFTNS